EGATTINLPDTVGYATSDETRTFFADLLERVPNADRAIFSAHCHDDLGLAVANSIAAVQGGARQIECTVNGIGERAGNASLERRRLWPRGLTGGWLTSRTFQPHWMRSAEIRTPSDSRWPRSRKPARSCGRSRLPNPPVAFWSSGPAPASAPPGSLRAWTPRQ